MRFTVLLLVGIFGVVRAVKEHTRGLEQAEAKSEDSPNIISSTKRFSGGLSDEARSIAPINASFIQGRGDFGKPGKGISVDALGEPKSGTTWLGRLVPSLALELCGSFNNPWCKMGGLVVTEHEPAPWYEFELLNKSNPGQDTERSDGPIVFLHFKGNRKHIIPGMFTQENNEGCRNGGGEHRDTFQDNPPCLGSEPLTRQLLEQCLWNTSASCLSHTASPDPNIRRSIVIFRDPRDVVRSAYRMRVEVYHQENIVKISVEQYIRQVFEASHLGLIGMAAFIGLQCSHEQAIKVWEDHKMGSYHGDYNTSGLSEETIEWMTSIMAKLLPPSLALRWGVIPTDLFR